MMPTQPIIYRETAPCMALSPFIDAFWTVTGANKADQTDRILPDGCVDIIFNTGPAFITEQGRTRMCSDEAYLVGTMTRFKDMIRPPGTQLYGIRFKPGGFTCFYDPLFLRSTADSTVLFDRSLFPLLADRSLPASRGPLSDPAIALNRYFLDRLRPASRDLLPVLADIRESRRRFTVDQLARRHFLTARTMERLFDRHLAIGPREFLNFTRLQSALESIRRRNGKTLLDIACEHGYYDHAHLSNAVRKHTGSAPSGL